MLSLCAIIAVVSENLGLMAGCFVLMLLTEVVSAVFGAIILYRAWQTVQDGQARTTPGKAVGFLFIPIYNFYWIFVGFGGLAKELNAFRQRHNLEGETLPENLFVAQCILALLGIIITQIPVIGYLYGIAISVLGLNLFWRIFRVVNEIAGGIEKEQAVELYPESSTETS